LPSRGVGFYIILAGSTSYGEDFANIITLIRTILRSSSGVDAVIAKGYIDTNNLFRPPAQRRRVLTCWTSSTPSASAPQPRLSRHQLYSFALTSDIPSSPNTGSPVSLG